MAWVSCSSSWEETEGTGSQEQYGRFGYVFCLLVALGGVALVLAGAGCWGWSLRHSSESGREVRKGRFMESTGDGS